MARRPGTGQRWLSIAVTPLLLAASVPPAPRPSAAPAKTEMKHADSPRRDAAAPDPALLEYLGRYGEAADGFDPLGIDALGVDRPDRAPAPAIESGPGKEPR